MDSKKVLIIINSGPYGSDNAYNALRLSAALVKRPGVRLRLFLMSDGVLAALPHQTQPESGPDIEAMLTNVIDRGAEVGACVTCIKDRGLFGFQLLSGVEISTIDDLAEWLVESDETVTF